MVVKEKQTKNKIVNKEGVKFPLTIKNDMRNLQNLMAVSEEDSRAIKILADNTKKLLELNKPDAICMVWRLFKQVVNEGVTLNYETINMTTDTFIKIFKTDYPGINRDIESQRDYIINMIMTGDCLRGYDRIHS